MESGKRDSNPRPQPWQGCALPTELFPQYQELNTTSASGNHFKTNGTSTASSSHSSSHREGVQRFDSPRHGGEGNRTPDLLNAIQALSQLSYAPDLRFARRLDGRTALSFTTICWLSSCPAVTPSSSGSAGTTKYSRGYPRVSTNWDWRKTERPVFCSASRNLLRKVRVVSVQQVWSVDAARAVYRSTAEQQSSAHSKP